MATKSNQAQAAAMIRTELKKRGFKCTARSDSFSMGDSVTVRVYHDVTPEQRKEIEAFCDEFQYGHFDGMIDLYEYSNRRTDIPQSKYVHVEFDYSAEIRAEVKAYIGNIGGIGEYERDRYEYMALIGSWGYFWKDRTPKPHARYNLDAGKWEARA